MDDFEEYYKETIDQYFGKSKPKIKVKFTFRTNHFAYLHELGITILQFKQSKSGDWDHEMFKAFTWREFKIISYYSSGKGDDIDDHYTFFLNARKDGKTYSDKKYNDMVKILIDNANDLPKYKSLIKTSLNAYISTNKIQKLKPCNFLGYSYENGWQLNDQFKLITGSSNIRAEIANNIKKNLEDVKYDPKLVIQYMKKIYEYTGIEYKDYFFAFGLVACFIPALKTMTRIAPPLALGGESEEGKTPMMELISSKFWGHIEGNIGESFKSEAQFQHYTSAAALPMLIDDCEDLPPETIGMSKRSTTQKDTVKKLNADQSTKVSFEIIAILLFTYNAFPAIFTDIAMRKRMVNYMITYCKKNPNWIKLFNKIPDGMIGWYIIRQTRAMKFKELYALYESMDSRGYEDRIGYIIKYYELGKYFMEKWFGIKLNLKKLPVLIRKTISTSDEDIMSLIATMIQEGMNFVPDKAGAMYNTRRGSWVKYPIERKVYKKEKGIFIHADNVTDLSNHLKKQNINSPAVVSILKANGWKDILNKNFTKNRIPVRAIWVPMKYINGVAADQLEIKDMEDTGELADLENEINTPPTN